MEPSRLLLDQAVTAVAYVIVGEPWHCHNSKAVCVGRDFQKVFLSVTLSVPVPCPELGTRAACTAGHHEILHPATVAS